MTTRGACERGWPGREHTLPRSLIIHAVSHHHDHGHSHAPADASAGRLKVALALLVGLMAVEVVFGILASSLALLSDAAHMLTDAGAIAAGAGGDPARAPAGARAR